MNKKKNFESANTYNETITKLNIYQWFRLILTLISVPLFLFVCAKDFGWWQAWIISGLFLSASLGGRIWAERRHPGILVERNRYYTASDVKQWDKVLAPLMGICIAWPIFVVAGLDHRFGWSLNFSVWFNIIGMLIVGAGYFLAVWALVENRFFSSMVRIQRERGHTVCDNGPYRFIRHPGYTGNILALPGIVLALDSTWAIIPLIIALSISIIRTELEDRALNKDLQGYQDYAQRVRYKIIPGIF
jgi:protein-S-isoprenylcysteine O-methyltransferase Ste14